MSKRIKVEGRTGVYFRVAKRIGKPGTEKVYYVRYKLDDKIIEVKAGRQYKDQMTPAKAERYRANIIEGRELTPQAKRKAAKKVPKFKWTIEQLWTEYEKTRVQGKTLISDRSRYNKYLKSAFPE